MNKEKDIIVPRWFLERIEDTLRIQYNINEPDMKETGESCQDRNIKQCLNGARKLLNGEELTGMERQEKLQSSLPSGLDEAEQKYVETCECPPANQEEERMVYEAYKAGWVARDAQFSKLLGDMDEAAEYCADLMCAELYATFNTRYDKKEKCLISKLTSGDVANIKEFGYKLFKAGAEWLAEQGVTKEITIGTTTDKMVITVTQQTMDMLGVQIGDKVIFQIRKK